MSDSTTRYPTAKSCGVLCFRRDPELAFLLMKHQDRLDLPKGHVDLGETEIECALREFEEETGLARDILTLDPRFRFETSYVTRVERNDCKPVLKSVIIFLAFMNGPHPTISVSEHLDSAWIPWNPPHHIQTKTIDPLLAAVDAYWKESSTAQPREFRHL